MSCTSNIVDANVVKSLEFFTWLSNVLGEFDQYGVYLWKLFLAEVV